MDRHSVVLIYFLCLFFNLDRDIIRWIHYKHRDMSVNIEKIVQDIEQKKIDKRTLALQNPLFKKLTEVYEDLNRAEVFSEKLCSDFCLCEPSDDESYKKNGYISFRVASEYTRFYCFFLNEKKILGFRLKGYMSGLTTYTVGPRNGFYKGYTVGFISIDQGLEFLISTLTMDKEKFNPQQ